MANQSNSLKERNFKIENLNDVKDAKGNVFEFKATSPHGTEFLFKRTKSGLRAYRKEGSKDSTTIAGFYSFTATPDGSDLIGEPFKTERKKGPQSASGSEGQQTESAA